jgi:hypothetical protein
MPSMAAFNLRVRGSEGDGSASVAEGENQRRPSGTDAHAKGWPEASGRRLHRLKVAAAAAAQGRRR